MQAPPAAESSAQELVASLALMYLRHADPARALALGVAAMGLGPVTPALALIVASAFLRTGDAEQAAEVLSRFDAPEATLAHLPDADERAAALTLQAKACLRLGRHAEARAALAGRRGADSAA